MSFGNVGEKDVGEKHQHRRLKIELLRHGRGAFLFSRKVEIA